MKFRKRTPEIEAYQYDGAITRIEGIPQWTINAYQEDILHYEGRSLYLELSDGTDQIVRIGDYIVLDPEGYIYLYDRDRFEQLYEQVK